MTDGKITVGEIVFFYTIFCWHTLCVCWS